MRFQFLIVLLLMGLSELTRTLPTQTLKSLSPKLIGDHNFKNIFNVHWWICLCHFMPWKRLLRSKTNHLDSAIYETSGKRYCWSTTLRGLQKITDLKHTSYFLP